MASEPKYKLVREIPRKDILFCVARVLGTQRYFVGSSDGDVYFFDLALEKIEPVALPGHSGYVTGVATGVGDVLVSGGSDGYLIWWNSSTREQIRKIKAHDKWVRAVKASPDGKWIASVADDMVCGVWNVETGMLKHELRGHEALTPQKLRSMLFTCAFSPDGTLLATADKVGHIVVWDLAEGKAVGGVEAPLLYTWDGTQRLHSIGGVRALAFSPDGTQLAAGGIGQIGNIDGLGAKARVEIFDWRKKTKLAEITPEKQGLVEFLHYHPNGDWLLMAGGGAKGFMIFVEPKERKILLDETPPMVVHDMAMDEGYKRIFAVGHNKAAVYEEAGR